LSFVRATTDPINCSLLMLLNADAGDHNHPSCAAAILSGLQHKTTPSFLIHLTGTGCISDERTQSWEGNYNPHIWDDVREINEIYNLPDSAKHHVIDKNIMSVSSELLKTACVCPPDIYGQSTGIGNRATFLVPEYVKIAMEKKEAFYLGKGENIRAVTHIDDVVGLFVILVGEAIQGGGSAQWGKEVCCDAEQNLTGVTDINTGLLLCSLG
jgi:nucleoside-diphosphate-sugar epimerase